MGLDAFESRFRAAAKPRFRREPVAFRTLWLVTDLESPEAHAYAEEVCAFLKVLGEETTVEVLDRSSAVRSVDQLLERARETPPDLICTYRQLFEAPSAYRASLGQRVDVLTQATPIPVLLLPHPVTDREHSRALTSTHVVMAMTDHLAGDDRLVNAAASLVTAGGHLWLTHVEDGTVFDRYVDAISRIPDLDTDVARETILERLLLEPRDYIRSCREVLEGRESPASRELEPAAPTSSVRDKTFHVDEVVTVGHHLAEYRRLVEEHSVDVLVLNTKDHDQLAMHGLAYPLAVELFSTPMLLL